MGPEISAKKPCAATSPPIYTVLHCIAVCYRSALSWCCTVRSLYQCMHRAHYPPLSLPVYVYECACVCACSLLVCVLECFCVRVWWSMRVSVCPSVCQCFCPCVCVCVYDSRTQTHALTHTYTHTHTLSLSLPHTHAHTHTHTHTHTHMSIMSPKCEPTLFNLCSCSPMLPTPPFAPLSIHVCLSHVHMCGPVRFPLVCPRWHK